MHYRNGREAKVGDPVVGTTYNRKGQVAGVLVSLTPGPDVYSAKVGFLDFMPGATPLAWGTNRPVYVQGTSHHGAQEPLAAVVYAEDLEESLAESERRARMALRRRRFLRQRIREMRGQRRLAAGERA